MQCDFEKAEFILKILTNTPQDFEVKEIPPLTSENSMFTLNRNVVPVATARADNNGSYGKKGNVTKYYYFDGKTCRIAQKSNNSFFINVKNVITGKFGPDPVDVDCMYSLKRCYRYNSANPFTQTIVEVKRVKEDKIMDYYYVLYKWKTSNPEERVLHLPRHGNATNPFTGNLVI